MSVTLKVVDQVARLARLDFAPEEKVKLIAELNEVLRYMEELNQVDTTNVEPLAQLIDAPNVLREDRRVPGLTRAEALQNAPSHSEEFFKVPKVIGDR
jgi:aspartyl-tRNA(Asn)/glutamyl-tRNA(Gln) amidotransferase subunit C